MPPATHGSNRGLLLATLAVFALLLYISRSGPSDALSTRATPKQRVPAPAALVNQAAAKVGIALEAEREVDADKGVLQQRIVAVGDIHGDLPALTSILRRAELIDLKGQWIGGETILVQTGDIVDRGPDTIALYRFFQALRPQMMNAMGDLRYVTKEDIASFGGERNRREAFSTGWIGQEFRANYTIASRVPYVLDFPHDLAAPVLPLTPHGSSDRRFLSDPEYPSGAAAAKDPFVAAAASFVHGGITPEYLATLDTARPIAEMNRIGREILFSLLSVPGGVPLSLPRSATPEQREFWSERGPMWNRDWAIEDEEEICERVERVCEALKVRRLIMGHTPQFEGILPRCDGKVLLIDTGISRAYGGAHSALSITYTLTPASALSVPDALSYALVDLADADPAATLAGREMERTWVEEEVVEALYTKGRETETLGRWERVVVVPE
ncbi:hypothetical protein JCM10450v2_005564 [Rhodotorula kratochvilovae]